MNELSKTDTTEPELTKHSLGTTATPAPRIATDLELRLALLLLDECLLCHDYCTSRRKGKPKAVSKARPSASVRADVTIEMSIPRVVSIWS